MKIINTIVFGIVVCLTTSLVMRNFFLSDNSPVISVVKHASPITHPSSVITDTSIVDKTYPVLEENTTEVESVSEIPNFKCISADYKKWFTKFMMRNVPSDTDIKVVMVYTTAIDASVLGYKIGCMDATLTRLERERKYGQVN